MSSVPLCSAIHNLFCPLLLVSDFESHLFYHPARWGGLGAFNPGCQLVWHMFLLETVLLFLVILFVVGSHSLLLTILTDMLWSVMIQLQGSSTLQSGYLLCWLLFLILSIAWCRCSIIRLAYYIAYHFNLSPKELYDTISLCYYQPLLFACYM